MARVTPAWDRGRAPRRTSCLRLAKRAELRDDARYTIVLNDFMATGSAGRIVIPAAAPNDTRIAISDP